MKAVHSSACEDRSLLRELVIQELKDRGITANIDQVKPKKSKAPFSTPGGSAPPSGRVFGRKIAELSKVYETLDGLDDSSVLVPTFVVHACNFIQAHVRVEGLFRMAGSAARQKSLRREIEAQEIVDFRTIDPPPYVLDVASLLKQFLRELPQPLLPTNFHELFAKCISGEQSVDTLLLGILLLPKDQLNCLTYIARIMHTVADNRAYNKMDARNLAIVLTPSIFSITDLCAPTVSSKDKKKMDTNAQNKLGNNMTIIEILINQAHRVGVLPEYLKEKYDVASLLPHYGTSQSEDNMDDNGLGPSQRKKNKHKRNRSGSLSRVLGAVGKGIQKAMSRNATPAPRKTAPGDIHSTPLPNFGTTPDFPSPRVRPKRKAEEHELSPSTKQSKRTFESTFTPKMRTRSFSVKRFKRKKSEGKLSKAEKASFVIHANLASPGRASLASSIASSSVGQSVESSLAGSMNSLAMTPKENHSMDWDHVDGNKTVEDEGDYAEVKAQYLELKDEVNKLETEMNSSGKSQVDIALDVAAERYRSSMAGGEETAKKVAERYEAAKEAGGRLNDVPLNTASKMAKVRRRSSERERKMRSPSERRIGVIRKRSMERESKSPGKDRGRSPTRRSPIAKEAITPMNLDKSYMKAKLQRGQPNTFMERPSPVIVEKAGGRPRVKMSFKEKIQPEKYKLSLKVGADEARRLESSPKRASRKESTTSQDSGRSLKKTDSITSLKTDISNLIENSFGLKRDESLSEMDDCVFENDDNDKTVNNEEDFDPFDQATPRNNPIYENAATIVDNIQTDNTDDLTSKLAGVTFETPVAVMSSSSLFTDSPITRSQLRRQSSAFEFARPLDAKLQVPEDRISLRRQSSAFEFVSEKNEPIYENFMRTNSTRASLRRRNSSVKNLIQKMETEANKRMGYDVFRAKPAVVAPAANKVDAKKRFNTEDPPMEEIGEEEWTNASDFFNSDMEALQVEAPQCGRSSIAKIQMQNRGKVSEAVNKFSKPVGPKTPGRRMGATPNRRPTPGNRRQSARMGIATTASPNLMNQPGGSARRLTLTGIKTTTAARRTSHYTKETLSSMNKQREKSPLCSAGAARRLGTQKSPVDISKRRGTPIRVAEAIYANVPQKVSGQKVERRPSNNKSKVERKSSNSRDLGRKNNDVSESNVRRSVSNGKEKERKIRRHGSNPGKKEKKKEVRRHLTIAYPGEVRSPLKERQNQDANVKRSNSDQTPSKKNNPVKPKPNIENNDYVNVVVVRKHSLRSDLLMSPRPDIPTGLQETIADVTTPRSDKVRRAMSDRCHTPRTTTPFIKGALRTPVHKGINHLYGNLDSVAFKSLKNEMSPRRSPRLVKE